MNIKIYADGADINNMLKAYEKGVVSGFTTNPTLMRKSGITDYLGFAKEALSQIKDMPISFEVFSDDIVEMEKQAFKLRDLGENVYVKIPVTNTKGIHTYDLISKLTNNDVKVNVTAIFTEEQVKNVSENICNGTSNFILQAELQYWVDPEPLMKNAVSLNSDNPEKRSYGQVQEKRWTWFKLIGVVAI